MTIGIEQTHCLLCLVDPETVSPKIQHGAAMGSDALAESDFKFKYWLISLHIGQCSGTINLVKQLINIEILLKTYEWKGGKSFPLQMWFNKYQDSAPGHHISFCQSLCSLGKVTHD